MNSVLLSPLEIHTKSSVRRSLHTRFKIRSDSAVRGSLHFSSKNLTKSAVYGSLHFPSKILTKSTVRGSLHSPFQNSDRLGCPWIPASLIKSVLNRWFVDPCITLQKLHQIDGPWIPIFQIRTDSTARESLLPPLEIWTVSPEDVFGRGRNTGRIRPGPSHDPLFSPLVGVDDS